MHRKTTRLSATPMNEQSNVAGIPVGVVGLGLMGSSIVAALLIAGHPVKAISPITPDAQNAYERIFTQLNYCLEAGLIDSVEKFRSMLHISEDYATLAPCEVVIECVIEKLEIKSEVYKKITSAVSPSCIIGSNTSAIPISDLQTYVANPERFLGIHWAEPAFMTRFLEITCGNQTTATYADRIFSLAHRWGKEPTLLKKDIRGFITNRLMYSVYREIFHQIESGNATREDVDKAFRYDAGSWMTLMGLFRRMDYTGLKDYGTILNNIFPQLSNTETVPPIMQKMVTDAARGVHNDKGLYPYEPGEGKQWDEAFTRFNQEIHQLAANYSEENVKNQLNHTKAKS
ncbi:3-hydroxyacyl-CoA dehydrogenase family protein [Dyadobacter sp. CY343]|uniref:3-hydroxyacyl-CoA dehydrogenase family protein n=1 Tax=Dyadobacter sp. CY343 TaxID=2907299 RepID=UPI001F2D66F0|nr:3-hydroxyacyl-CoA dehydrogenase family protein [Dyadobacter sp. CY343]MCE7063201.1 3-hydroxyacyl-CoA dehydrogenase family protein [Dyadobacter sp. CY343]